MPPTQQNRFLAIATALGGDTLAIKSFSMTEQMGRLFQMEVELQSEDRAIKFDDIVGTAATVTLKTPKGQKRFFNGCVSRFVQMEHQGSFALYRATLVPWLWFLTRTSDCRIFQNKKVSDIIEEVFKGHGFKDYTLKLNGDYGEWEYCVQYRETDFNFVSRLMEQEGIYYYFEHKDGGHSLVLTDSPSAHEPFPDYATLVYRPPTTKQEEGVETVTDWVIEKEVQPGMYVMGDFNHTTPKAAISGNANITRQHQKADFEIFDYPGEFEQRAEGEGYAKVRIQELQAQHEILRGQATVRGIATGSKFTLKSHPRADQNRDYVITGASIQITAGEYETGKGGGGEFYSCSFTAMPAAETFRTPRTTPKPMIQGPQTAIVVGPKGEEIHTDDQARVKVHFHWDRHGAFDENASCWVRVSQLWAGKTWGAMHIPRMGQEVIIEFLEGDPDRPIITGRVYNTDQTAPYALPANKTQSGIKSRSSKAGAADNFNEIRFEDKKGGEEVYMQAEKDLNLLVKNCKSETVKVDKGITVGGNHSEQITGNKKLGVGGNHIEQIGGNMSLTVSQAKSETIALAKALTIGAAYQISVGALMNTTVGASKSEEVGAFRSAIVGANDTEKIAGKKDISVGKDFALAVQKNLAIAVKEKGSISTTQDLDVASEKTLNIKAKESLLIESEKDITIKSGDAQITLKKDGTIEIKGGKINLKADGDIKIKGSKVGIN